ncbi:MAG: DUF4393 domain-containing protein, partial [Bacteroidaceae bacterium]|nr:DUF4393 domain-containing protein [Bacteroidaceae bacterium]
AVKNGVHPSFVEIIKQLCPDEAKILKVLINEIRIPVISVYSNNVKGKLKVTKNLFSDITERANCELGERHEEYFNNLMRIGLISKAPHKYTLGNEKEYEKLENNPEIKDAIHDISSRKDGVINIHIDRSYLELTLFGIRFCNICIG